MSSSEKKYRQFIHWPFIILAAFFAVLIAGGLYAFFREQSYTSSLNQLYHVQKKAQTWLADYKSAKDSEDEKNMQELAQQSQEIVAELDNLAKKSFAYITQSALFNKALIYYEQGENITAAETFAKIFARYGRSLLGVKAGLNAAAAYENAQEPDLALNLYKKVSKVKKVPKLWEEASFHAARMTENKDIVLAIELYRKLINKLEDGNFWRTLSENRLLSLEVQQ